MRLITALLNLVLLICPCALCYGQFGFSSIVGEGGYAAFKGAANLALDNGITFVPFVGYYRPSDSEEDEKLALKYNVSPAKAAYINSIKREIKTNFF